MDKFALLFPQKEQLFQSNIGMFQIWHEEDPYFNACLVSRVPRSDIQTRKEREIFANNDLIKVRAAHLQNVSFGIGKTRQKDLANCSGSRARRRQADKVTIIIFPCEGQFCALRFLWAFIWESVVVAVLTRELKSGSIDKGTVARESFQISRRSEKSFVEKIVGL